MLNRDRWIGLIDIYDKIANNPGLLKRIADFNKVATIIGYVAYPVLLVLLAIFDLPALALRVAVPAAGFIIVSIFRYIYNAPRPYEGPHGRPALIPKSTSGKSFPSRHTFCMFMIAFAWISWIPWGIAPGCVLVLFAIGMGAARVSLGVHYVRDVIAGAVAAIVFSMIGYLVF